MAKRRFKFGADATKKREVGQIYGYFRIDHQLSVKRNWQFVGIGIGGCWCRATEGLKGQAGDTGVWGAEPLVAALEVGPQKLFLLIPLQWKSLKKSIMKVETSKTTANILA